MNFKEQTGIKQIVESEQNRAATLISMCFEARTKTHIAHLQSKSYSEHIALSAFYASIVDLTDVFAEAYQGKYGIITQYPDTYLTGSGIDIVKGLRTWIEENRNKISSDSNLQNEIDNIITLCNSTIYKLQFLK